MSVLDIIATMQTVAVAFFLTTVLGGIVSALVYLGLFETFRRKGLQQKTLESFFGDDWPALLDRAPLLKSRDSFRLHYRQICGHLISRVSEEMASEPPVTQGVTELLTRLHDKDTIQPGPEQPPDHRESAALRMIDRIQLRLATVINREVMFYVGGFWFVGYSIALFLTWRYSILPALSEAGADSVLSMMFRAIGEILFAILTLFLLLLVSIGVAGVALSTAAVAVIAFIWIDRTIAER